MDFLFVQVFVGEKNQTKLVGHWFLKVGRGYGKKSGVRWLDSSYMTGGFNGFFVTKMFFSPKNLGANSPSNFQAEVFLSSLVGFNCKGDLAGSQSRIIRGILSS